MLQFNFLLKKNYSRYISFLFFFFIYTHTTAQVNRRAYRDSLFKKNADTSTHLYSQTRPYYIAEWQEQAPTTITTGTIKIIRQLDEKIAIVEIKSHAGESEMKQWAKIAVANDHWKLSPIAEQFIEKSNTTKQQYILSGVHTSELLEALKKIKIETAILSIDEASHSVVIQTTGKFIKGNLISLKELIFIDLRAEPHPEINIIGYNRSFHGLNAVDYSIPGANGNNIVAGVKEQKMEESDLTPKRIPEFTMR